MQLYPREGAAVLSYVHLERGCNCIILERVQLYYPREGTAVLYTCTPRERVQLYYPRERVQLYYPMYT